MKINRMRAPFKPCKKLLVPEIRYLHLIFELIIDSYVTLPINSRNINFHTVL